MALPQEKINRDQQTAAPPDLTREYVSSGGFWGARIGRVLSNFVDDLEFIVSLDVYERMARDPTISKNLQFQKLSITSEGVQLNPAISDKASPEYDLAHEIRDFHIRSMAGLHRPIEQIIGEMLVALKRGYSVSEVTYREPIGTGPDAYKLLFKSIKVKPRNSTAFVIDEYRNVLGLTAWVWGGSSTVEANQISTSQTIVPMEKFAVLAFETEDEDPRGLNILRAAYNFWQAKCLVPGLHLKWLEKSGIPSTVGFTADKAEDEVIDGEKRSAQEIMADMLANLESGSTAAFPFGSKVEKIEVAGNGSQFTRSYQDFDTQIDYAVSLQSGATKDSKSGSYSSKRIFKDVLDILVWSRKHTVAQVLQGIMKNSTRYNFGEDKVHLTPFVLIGDEEGKDWAMDADAASKIAPYLTDSQWLKLCQELGIAAPIEGEELPTRIKAVAPNPADTATAPDGNQPPGNQPGNQKPGNQPPNKDQGGGETK